MTIPHGTPRLLAAARAAMKEQGTNPYRLAKATGLSVSSVQNLLSERVSPSVRNIELVLHALGFEVRAVKTHAPVDAAKKSLRK